MKTQNLQVYPKVNMLIDSRQLCEVPFKIKMRYTLGIFFYNLLGKIANLVCPIPRNLHLKTYGTKLESSNPVHCFLRNPTPVVPHSKSLFSISWTRFVRKRRPQG
uniref:Uncharacterized protein n=1 Tax=Cacopsylla melanoneura TaxID=428564 RepID=A0A8D8WN29_9HEMI